MHKILRKILKNRWFIRALIPSLYFNLRYLPFLQAIKVPIIIYKSKCYGGGKITIENPHFGQVRLGIPSVNLYPSSGIIIENKGHIHFRGQTRIGNASAISVGEMGKLIFGNYFKATTSFKCVCYHNITFEDKVTIGWDCIITDTDFHLMKSVDGSHRTIGFGAIHIGHHCWISLGCVILKNTTLPPYTTVGACSLLSHRIETEPFSTIAGNPPRIIKKGFYMDIDDCKIDYKKYYRKLD